MDCDERNVSTDNKKEQKVEAAFVGRKAAILEKYAEGYIYLEPLKIFPAEQYVVVEEVGAEEDALTETEGSETTGSSAAASNSAGTNPSVTTLTNMCTTPGQAQAAFGYAWSFANPQNEQREGTTQEIQANINYQVNNNQQEQGNATTTTGNSTSGSNSTSKVVEVKPVKVSSNASVVHRSRPMFVTVNEHQQTSSGGHHGATTQTIARSKKSQQQHQQQQQHHEVFTTATCDKSGCNCDAAHHATPSSLFSNTLVFTTADKHAMSKHFMSPIGPLQLTAEECNEILMKRAAQAAQANSVSGSQDVATAAHFGHVLTHVNASQIETKVKVIEAHQQEIGSQVRVPKERPYSCSECGKSFLLKHHLTTHARVHTGERPHICPHCGKSFAHKHCLHTHLLLHSSERPYQCRECKKSFTLKHHLVTHTRVHTRERPFICQECGRAFPLKRHLVTHGKFHSGERPYVCEECGESFSQKDHLTMHSRFHGSLHPFVCQDCGATFQRKFELVNHGRLHGRVPHSCSVCGKEFLQKRTLLAHMRLHTGETPFACTVCGEAFSRKAELVAHSKIHNNSNDEKSLTCRECGLDFTNREGLTLHLRLHTGDRTAIVTDLCGLAAAFQQTPGHFLTQNASGTHQVLQMNGPITPSVSHMHGATQTSPPVGSGPKPKPHLCPDCGRGFAQKHGLSQHQRRHTDGSCHIRSHVCDKCGKAFFQKNHLLLHQRQHMDPPPSILRQQQRQAAQAAAQQAQQQQNNSTVDTKAIQLQSQSQHQVDSKQAIQLNVTM